MGRTTSKKMIPLLLLRILWIHADKDHMISMEYICDRLEDEFDGKKDGKTGIAETGIL